MGQSTDVKVKKDTRVDPSNIMQIGMGFWASKTLLTAVKMELFTFLAGKPLTGAEIKHELCLNGRGMYDFLDTLVALGFLHRKGSGETARYSNTADSDFFLDKGKMSYMGGILEMANNRLYPFWNFLEEGLTRGTPQNETRTGEKSPFEAIYADPDKTREFVNAMSGVQAGNFIAFATQFDFSSYNTLCDVGGAGAHLSAQVAIHNPHMKCTSFDLPPVSPVALENISLMGVANKVNVVSGDFFEDDIPSADVITMGNILHGLDEQERLILMKKAYDALPEGGALVVIESLIDDDRRENAFGLMMSLNMLIETAGGSNFSAADFKDWATKTGFRETSLMSLSGPNSAVVAIK